MIDHSHFLNNNINERVAAVLGIFGGVLAIGLLSPFGLIIFKAVKGGNEIDRNLIGKRPDAPKGYENDSL